MAQDTPEGHETGSHQPTGLQLHHCSGAGSEVREDIDHPGGGRSRASPLSSHTERPGEPGTMICGPDR